MSADELHKLRGGTSIAGMGRAGTVAAAPAAPVPLPLPLPLLLLPLGLVGAAPLTSCCGLVLPSPGAPSAAGPMGPTCRTAMSLSWSCRTLHEKNEYWNTHILFFIV